MAIIARPRTIGPVSLEAPEGVELVNIVSAQDLFDAVSARFAEELTDDEIVMVILPTINNR